MLSTTISLKATALPLLSKPRPAVTSVSFRTPSYSLIPTRPVPNPRLTTFLRMFQAMAGVRLFG
jgi:hypothetical protein